MQLVALLAAQPPLTGLRARGIRICASSACSSGCAPRASPTAGSPKPLRRPWATFNVQVWPRGRHLCAAVAVLQAAAL
jgi:hypothetical protein